MASAGYKNDQEKKQNKTAEQTDNISPRGFRHENENTAYFWINLALEATNWSHITFCIPTNVLTSISESLPQFWANKHFADSDHHYGGLHTKLANLTKFFRGGRMWRKELKNGL